MKAMGTGIRRVAPHEMLCAWCKNPILPLQDFIWWHKHVVTIHIVPVHPKCWEIIIGQERRSWSWKKDLYQKLLLALSVEKLKTLYIGLKAKTVKR